MTTPSSGPVARAIRDKLAAAFAPQRLEVLDESHRHVGHAGHRPGGESHFSIRMTAAAFADTSRLERQRMVHRALADELAGPVHALSLELEG